ncbi:UNVERIFIED_CONTAM: O-antigen/teichoic acid export membrane protein [Acetivibrio alkalicellulosi]
MNDNEVTKSKVVTSLFWKFIERGGTQGISFLVSILLARLVLPEEYGLIALMTIFISLANVFVQKGFSTALIQKKNADEIDFSTVFYVNLIMAGIIYIILIYASPFIAKFYNESQLVVLLKVLSVTLFLGAINSVQIAILTKRFQFKKLLYSSLLAIVISGVLSIVLAFKGFGVWALITQQIVNQFIVTLVMWFTVKWRPKLVFSIKRLKGLFSFGTNMLLTNFIGTLSYDIRGLVIGKMYTSSMLAFFNRGKQFPSLIIRNIDDSIQAVMLPAYSFNQDNKKRVKEIMRRSITTSSFIIFPIMIGLAVIAEPLTKILLTEKWLPSVPFMQIFCISFMLKPIHSGNIQAIKGLGYSSIILRLEIIKKIIEFLILVISIKFGVYAIALGTLIASLISMIINIFPNKKLVGYSYLEQLRDLLPSLLISLFMGGIVYLIQLINLQQYLTLFLQVLIGVITYVLFSNMFKLEPYIYVLKEIKKFRSGKNQKKVTI